MTNKLVDVGTIEEITFGTGPMLMAAGNRFRVKTSKGAFLATPQFDLRYHQLPVVDILLNDGATVASVFDERICALTYALAANPYQSEIVDRMQDGDKLPLRSSEESWEIIRNTCEYSLIDVIWGLMRTPRTWVDCDGNECDEPEWFIRKLTLLVTLCTLHYYELPQNAGNVNSQYERVLSHIGECIDSLKLTPSSVDADHDFMMDWYEVTATAARTINNHIDLGDCRPNMDKVDKFFDFANKNCRRMEKLCARHEYAKHLWAHKERIEQSRANGWKLGVEPVETYKISAFGKGT